MLPLILQRLWRRHQNRARQHGLESRAPPKAETMVCVGAREKMASVVEHATVPPGKARVRMCAQPGGFHYIYIYGGELRKIAVCVCVCVYGSECQR